MPMNMKSNWKKAAFLLLAITMIAAIVGCSSAEEAAPVATATPAPMTHIPQTSDTFPLALLIAILAISGGALALLIVGKKRKK